MPGFLCTMTATVLCAHGGKCNFAAPNPRVKIMGVPVPMSVPPVLVAGCANPPPPVNVGPDVTANWIPVSHTTRVKSNNLPLVCQTSKGIAVPSGTPINVVMAGQTKVKGI